MSRLANAPADDAGEVYRRLLSYARPHRGMFMIGVLGMALFAATDGALVLFVKKFIDGTFDEKNARVLWLVPIGAPVLFLLRGIGDYMSVYFPGLRRAAGHQGDPRRPVPPLPAAARRVTTTARARAHLLSRLTYNIEQVAEATTKSITSLIRDTLTIVVLIGIMFYLNWKLALFVLLLAPPLSWLIRNVSRSFRRYSARIQSSMGDVTRVVKEALDGQRVIKVFNAQDAEAREFEKVNEHNRSSNMKLIAARAISNPVVQFIASLGLGGILWVALRQIQNGQLTAGEFMAFLAALLMTTAPLKRLMDSFVPLQQGLAAGASIFEVLDEPREDFKSGEPLPRLSRRARVPRRELRVHQREGRGAALGVAARARRQEHRHRRALRVSGKSTLVALVPRFYDATAGAGARRRRRRARVQPARPARTTSRW